MTLSQVFDRLRGQYVNRIDFKDGTAPLLCHSPTFVGFDDKDGDPLPGIWLNASAEGLTISFNTGPIGDMRGQEEPLANVAHVS